MTNNIPFVFHDLQDSQMFALAQAAGKQGFAVEGIVQKKTEAPWAQSSQHIQKTYEIPSLGDINAGLYAIQLKKNQIQGVFVPMVDDIAELLAEFAPLLRKNGLQFLSPHPNHIEMSNTFALQNWNGELKIPSTAYCAGDELVKTAKNIGFPVILKSYRDGFVTFYHESEMQSWLNKHPDYPFHFVQRVQHYVEGTVNSMATAMLLFDNKGNPVRGFTARRIRVAQTLYGPFGETVAAQAEWIPKLYDAAVELLQAIGWVGFAEVECKQDESGAWHLLEINPRLSGWSCLAEADGAGFLAAYHHLCTNDGDLEPLCSQQSKTTYSRMIASSRHQPDWDNYNKKTYKSMLRHQANHCFGAWDKEDRQANLAWAKLMHQRYLTER